MVEENEYTLDITEAILSIRKIEGPECIIGFHIGHQYEYIRFKPYPYKKSLLKVLLDVYGIDHIKAVEILYKERLNKYFDDYIYNYNIT